VPYRHVIGFLISLRRDFMSKGLILGFLSIALLGASVAAWAGTTHRAASSRYEWITPPDCNIEVPIYARHPHRHTEVVVHVDNCEGSAGVNLKGCNHAPNVFVCPGETVTCRIDPGETLYARSATDCVEKGTLQLINI
jgi:hypothetical protein